MIPREDLIALAGIREVRNAEVMHKQAVKDFEEAQRQINALEEEALKALTGENKLDLGIVNNMIMKQKARLDAAAKAMEESKARLDAEKNQKRSNEIQVDEILTWASRFEDASYEAKHMVIAELVDRIEVKKDYDITIHWRMTAEQFLGKKTEASA